jgi:hypothetical protein
MSPESTAGGFDDPEWEIHGFRVQDTGCGVNEGGSSSLLEEAFFSELRVITMKTKKYSTLKTTTTTD